MRTTVLWLTSLLLIFPAIAMTGCNTEEPEKPSVNAKNGHEDHAHEEEEHAEGPHHGHIVELGDDETYHLEWLDDDDTKTVTFYLLDGDVKEEIAVPAAAILVTLTVEEVSREYKIEAVREGEAKTTAKFSTDSKEFFTMITGNGVKAQVAIDIDGTTYEGKIEGGHHHHH